MKKEYITLPIEQIIPNERNPRKNDSSVDAVAKSISETGYIAPIIINADNKILCGNTRFKSLKKLGHTEIEVLKVDGLTTEQEKRYIVWDNQAGANSEWDFDILKADFELNELEDFGFSFDDENEFSDKNKEIDVNEFADEMKITLNYSSDDYWKVIKQLQEIAQTPEQAVWKLLGNA